MISLLNAIPSQNIDSKFRTVITFGAINAEENTNSYLKGTIRYFDDNAYLSILNVIKQILYGIEIEK